MGARVETEAPIRKVHLVGLNRSVQIIGGGNDGTEMFKRYIFARMVDIESAISRPPSAVPEKFFFFTCVSVLLICKIILIMVLLKGYGEIVIH